MPLTDTGPKGLIRIAGRPLLDYWFDRLAEAGLYVLTADACREITDMDAAELGADVVTRLLGRTRGRVCRGDYLDIGATDSLQRARRDAPRVFLQNAEEQRRSSRLLGPIRPR